MCECRQKKSFLIEHILQDDKPNSKVTNSDQCGPFDLRNIRKYNTNDLNSNGLPESRNPRNDRDKKTEPIQLNCTRSNSNQLNSTRSNFEENMTKFEVRSEIRNELALTNFNMNLEHRRNTYPLYPTAIKAGLPWQYRKDLSHFSYYNEPMLGADHILRSQLASNRFSLNQFPRHYGYDGVPASKVCCEKRDMLKTSAVSLQFVSTQFFMLSILLLPQIVVFAFNCNAINIVEISVQTTCCNPWWGLAGRRKGGQVRFTATQTGALERRFNSSKYLSPDERRALAATLRLSDRQVKTWFQNRRAKWRRTTPDSADAASPTSEDPSDDEGKLTEEQ